jgi:hypothetical protein
MKTISSFSAVLLVAMLFFALSCQKETNYDQQPQNLTLKSSVMSETPPFNLEVILRGEGRQFGHVKFRQDVDAAKIVTLDVWVRDLEPNHEYLLQRAVDTFIDGNCTSTGWLTLGKGLTPQSILTNDRGVGIEDLWRDISTIPSGSVFDIHFRVVDAASMAVVLNSDCYKYVVR